MRKYSKRGADGAQLLLLSLVDYRVLARDVPANHAQPHAGVVNHPRRFWVCINIKAAARPDVAATIRRAAHQCALLDFGGDARVTLQGLCHVGQRPQRDNFQLSSMCVHGFDNCGDSVVACRCTILKGQADVAHAIIAVHVNSIERLAA